MRKLFIVDHLGVGGVQEFILNYAQRVHDEEITVASLFREDVYSQKLQDAGANVVQITSASYAYGAILDPRNLLAFRSFVARELDRFDIVHVRLFASFLYASLTGLHRDPRVSSAIDATWRQLPLPILAMYWIFARRYKRFLLHPLYKKEFGFLRLNDDAVREVHYFVSDRASATPFPFTAPYNFLSVGRCIRQKGHQEAIRFFELLRPRLPGRADLYIIGDGPLLAELRAAVPAHLKGAVHFTGSVTNLSDYMTGCTAVLKLAKGEGQNSVLREAALLGRPVLSTMETPNCHDLAGKGIVVPIDREASEQALERAARVAHFTPRDVLTLQTVATNLWGDEVVAGKIKASMA